VCLFKRESECKNDLLNIQQGKNRGMLMDLKQKLEQRGRFYRAGSSVQFIFFC